MLRERIEHSSDRASEPGRPRFQATRAMTGSFGHQETVKSEDVRDIRVGYELVFDFPQSTPVITVLGTHFTRASDIIVPDFLTTNPSVPISPYRDVSAIGAAALSLLPAEFACRPMASFVIPACRTWLPLRLPNTRWRICRQRR